MKGKNYELIKELLDKELDDYSFFENREIEFTEQYDGWDYFYVDFHDLSCSLNLRANEESVEVEVGEGSYYSCNWWDTSVKHLWIALLEWPKTL